MPKEVLEKFLEAVTKDLGKNGGLFKEQWDILQSQENTSAVIMGKGPG